MKNVRLAILFLTLVAIVYPVNSQDRGLDVIAKAVAGNDVRIGKQYAVLIAVDRYKEWFPLHNPVKDAKTIKEILQRRYFIDEFIELYDENATAVGIRRLFSDLIDRTKQSDSVLIYYAGHGYTDKFKTGFWIPVDGGKDLEFQDRWVPNQQIRNFVTQMKARSIVLVSDSCFSGDLLNVHRGAAPTVDSAYFRNALKYTARQVLTSGASETVPDESEFSRQFKSLLENNTDTCVDPLAMYDRIRRGVTKTLPLLGTLPGQEEGGSYVLFLRESDSLPAAAGTGSAPASYRAPTGGDAELMVAVAGGVKDAEIYVNGTKMGLAPSLLQKLPAYVPLIVEVRSGLDVGKVELTLKPRELREISLQLERQKGNLFLEASERNVDVVLDGKPIGPLGAGLLKDIPAGRHALKLSGPGLYYSGSVTVPPNETTKINVKIPEVGYLEFAVEPKSASIAVNGVVLGSATHILPLGRHEVLLKAPGYRDASSTVVVEKGKTHRLETRLTLLTPASMSIKNPPYGLQVVFAYDWSQILAASGGGAAAPGSASYEVSRIPAGLFLTRRATVAFADSLDPAYADSKIIFAEGATEVREFPVGNFSVPMLPKGARLLFVPNRVGADSPSAVPVPMAGEGLPISLPLAAGRYTVSLSGEYARPFTVNIEAGKTVEPKGYRAFLTSFLGARRSAADRAVRAKAARTTAGWVSLGIGAAGTVATAVTYLLGAGARAAYDAAETSTDLQAARQNVQLWGTAIVASAAVGGVGLGLTPLLWGGPSRKTLEDAAKDFDEQIRSLAK
ncbi:MAG: PEGA domain-containing protein [Treponemataceae bacterium]